MFVTGPIQHCKNGHGDLLGFEIIYYNGIRWNWVWNFNNKISKNATHKVVLYSMVFSQMHNKNIICIANIYWIDQIIFILNLLKIIVLYFIWLDVGAIVDSMATNG